MNDIVLIILGIISMIIASGVLYSVPSAFLKEFEKGCHEAIQKRDKEIEEREKLNKELRKLLFK